MSRSAVNVHFKAKQYNAAVQTHLLMSNQMCDAFLYRHDFDVQFDSDIPTSVFNLLQQACFQMAKTSYRIWQKEGSATKPSQHHQRFVYSRFMWGQCMCK